MGVKISLYTCENCSKNFRTYEEAVKCFESHSKCHCENRKEFLLSEKCYDEKTHLTVLSFRTNQIEICRSSWNTDWEDTECLHKLLYCPFCGKGLIEVKEVI